MCCIYSEIYDYKCKEEVVDDLTLAELVSKDYDLWKKRCIGMMEIAKHESNFIDKCAFKTKLF